MIFEENDLASQLGEHPGLELGPPAFWEDMEVLPRIETEGLIAAQQSILLELRQKQEEFRRLTGIVVDEARIKAEIQDILDMDAAELDALEREVKARLAENRKKLDWVYK
ncbi:MAG: hypothetical protein GXO65_01265 [Euryarchaeota archaeon]|nr:hypothetical protein [Euryarchaeota archaeon]